ncbi:MAG: hypothetical protein KIS87_06340 [Phycisphaeraceae bacterium]|nr:hypothetical protein [Phycisphaeraceae bacterium]
MAIPLCSKGPHTQAATRRPNQPAPQPTAYHTHPPKSQPAANPKKASPAARDIP